MSEVVFTDGGNPEDYMIQSSADVTSLTGQILKEEFAMQRRAELWGEGHRLFDLLRKKEDLDRRGGRHN